MLGEGPSGDDGGMSVMHVRVEAGGKSNGPQQTPKMASNAVARFQIATR